MANTNNKYIIYYNYNSGIHESFFLQKQNIIRMLNEKDAYDKNDDRWNQILSNAQKDFSLINDYVSEENLWNAINTSMNNIQLSGSLEAMAGSISSFFNEAKMAASELADSYAKGYDTFKNLYEQVIAKPGVVIDSENLTKIVNNLSPEIINSQFNDVANPLGWIGEISGIIQLNIIADELLKTCFSNIPNVKAEIVNTGKMSTTNSSRLTTDNLLIIKDGSGNVLYQLNLSNKINTAFTKDAKSTKRAIKLRATTVNAFLSEHEDWNSSVFNVFSYHMDKITGNRYDVLNTNLGAIARETIGLQILYDHIFGTRESFELNDMVFKDEVGLIAYGSKIIASSTVLKNALFTRAMNDKRKLIKARVDRSSWFKTDENEPRSNVQNIYDAQTRIAKFGLIYAQTLQL